MKNTTIFTLFFLITSTCFSQISKSQIDAALVVRGLSPSGNDAYVVSSQSNSSKSGMTHVYLRQTINGIEIFNANSSIHFSKEGTVLSLNNGFIKNSVQKLVQAKNSMSPAEAMNKVADQFGKVLNFSNYKSGNSSGEFVVSDRTASKKDIKAKFVYLYKNKQLIPVWNIEFFDDKTGDWWNKRVDLIQGEIIDENNWTTHCKSSTIENRFKNNAYYAFQFEETDLMKKPVNASYKVYPFPFESPLKTSRQLVGSSATAEASPYGWHDTDGIAGADFTTTRGNNVFAKEDTLDQDSSNGHAPDGGSNLIFNFPNDSNAKPRQFLDAAITNLFYWNNIIHDLSFHYGFDEESGNFQQNNYGGLGIGDDYLFADAQDGSGTNNANFSTPPDGYNPRMQMFLWSVGGSKKLLNIISPLALKGQYLAAIAGFGPDLSPPGITANLAIGLDGSIDSNLCCAAITSNVTGKIALIDRGDCSFVNKVYNAQMAGAIAAIIVNNTPGAPFTMGTAPSGPGNLITIPSVMITKILGDTLKNRILANSVVNVTLVDSSGGVKYYDSDFDNGVIIHEYAHGISNRLTGGPLNTGCLYNAEQGGEGWSDFFALAFTARSYDNPQAGRGVGTYLIGEDSNGLGIRDYPYSRNMSINPVTYDYIKTNIEVHALGFVWATILYDIFWDLVDKHGFDNDIYNGNGGNNLAIQLIMDGLKLQPCEPGFVDARNAILLADSINNKFENYDLLWKAFARRGLGFYADQGLSSDATDGKQSFALPPAKPTGLNQLLNEKEIKVYPNPAIDLLTLEIPANVKMNQITLLDLCGKTVYVYPVPLAETKYSINLKGITSGIYFLKIQTETEIICRKIILN